MRRVNEAFIVPAQSINCESSAAGTKTTPTGYVMLLALCNRVRDRVRERPVAVAYVI